MQADSFTRRYSVMKMEKPIPSLAVLVSGNHPSLVWYCGVTDEWMLPAQSILDGEFTDKRSGKTAGIWSVFQYQTGNPKKGVFVPNG